MTEIFMAFSSPQKPKFKQTLTIWPYRSLSKHGFAIVMAVLASLAFCIGLGFFLLGAWPVIGFLGLEILVVWGAFKLNYRAARQRQKLTATERELVVENVAPTGETDIVRMPADWLRVEVTPKTPPEMSARYRQRIYVTSHGRRTEIGGFLHPVETPGLAAELSTMLENARDARLQAG
ncbi:MAG: DUF2244 domain-containing protein [Candidatus Puniceispirillaceae bacterium]